MTQRILFFLLAGVALFSACSTGPAEEAAAQAEQQAPVELAAAKEFDAADLKARLDSGENVYLLDVRRPEELAEHGAIEGYVNIPIDELEARVSEVPKDRKVVVYCMRGGRASRGAELLAKEGHSGVEFGGITEWKEHGYPVVEPTASDK
ncbi:MAG: rhodanese-like domain-containing protein [Acidobacteria bacterium]|nr:rhodanese-like domain-containing protein [Acidobacteriota bacterium]